MLTATIWTVWQNNNYNLQKVIRELHQREREYKKTLLNNTAVSEPEIITENIVYESMYINTFIPLFFHHHPGLYDLGNLRLHHYLDLCSIHCRAWTSWNDSLNYSLHINQVWIENFAGLYRIPHNVFLQCKASDRSDISFVFFGIFAKYQLN